MSLTVLTLGGARSGKSEFAERLTENAARLAGGEKHYVATARRFYNGEEDPALAARIQRHLKRRGAGWSTVEAPIDLAAALSARPTGAALIDCASLWLTNRLLDADATGAARDVDAFADALAAEVAPALACRSGDTVIVSNETGLGVAPATALGGRFRDAQGVLNQHLAAAADIVVLVIAGLPLTLKGDLTAWANYRE